MKSAQMSKKRKFEKLVNHLYELENMIVLDDENYFIYYCDRIPSSDGFFTVI